MQPLVPKVVFLQRMWRHVTLAFGITFVSLLVGVLGYHFLENIPWVDALLNASMILGGMGPVDQLHTNAGKIFASLYALYSGLIVLAVAAILLAPVVHRFLHHFHLETEDEDKG